MGAPQINIEIKGKSLRKKYGHMGRPRMTARRPIESSGGGVLDIILISTSPPTSTYLNFWYWSSPDSETGLSRLLAEKASRLVGPMMWLIFICGCNILYSESPFDGEQEYIKYYTPRSVVREQWGRANRPP